MTRLLLSVVVPVYNVEDYLKDAVDSIRRQAYDDLEVILVDDGSTDSSGDLCDEFAYRDPRIRVLHQRNGGLSNARNNGAAQATGDLLTFMDSDDLLFDDSYSRMISTITETGSDFVSGNVQRFNRRRGWQAWNQLASHTANRFRTSITEHPELVFDAVAWNKVFRRDFYQKAEIAFPEGKLYEDMVPMYRAYRSAQSVDILREPTYRWRVREEQNSISQRRSEYKNLSDKVEMVDTIHRDVRLRHQASLRDWFFRKVLEGDLWLYVEHVSAEGSTDFDQLLTETVRRYWRSAPASTKRILQQHRRVLYQALASGHPELVQPILSWYREQGEDLPVVHRRNKVFLDTHKTPKDWPRLSPSDRSLEVETRLTAAVTDIGFDDTDTLRIGGWAFVTLWPAAVQQVRVWLHDPHTDRQVEVPVLRTGLPSPAAAQASTDRQHDVSAVGFEAQLGRTGLAGLAGSGRRTKDWLVKIEVQTPESARRDTVKTFTRGGSISAIVPRFVADDVQIVPVANPGETLHLAVRRPFLAVEHAERQDRSISIDIRTLADATLSSDGDQELMELEDDQLGRTVQLEAEAIAPHVRRVSFELPRTPGERYVMWRLTGTTAGKPRRVAWSNDTKAVGPPESPGISIRASVGGWLVITDSARSLEVTSAVVDADATTLSIRASVTTEPGTIEMALARDDDRSPRWLAAEVSDTSASITFDLTTTDWYGISRPWRPGNYKLRARRVPSGRTQGQPVATGPLFVTVTPEATQELQRPIQGTAVTGRLSRSGGHDLTLHLETPIPPEDRGLHAKHRSLSQFGTGATVEPENSVFLRVNAGYGANDSALYLQREIERRGLDWTIYWGVRNRSVPVPPGGIALVDGQQQWYEKLARSRLVVNNYGGLWMYPKHPHQLYLQTWHGTPYKSIGLSEVRHQGGSSSAEERVRRESAEWDFLMSPNPYCSQIFPREFGYDGPLLATGMPRNDFAATATAAEQLELRQRLGIPDDTKVVLYAPTFRDSQRQGLNAARYRGLDLDTLARRLGENWMIMVRGHSFTERTSDRTAGSGQVLDVTDVPDIAELYVAADACITDYSSAMFDFAVTGKPLFYFTPDLESYITNRSVYFDLKDVAPSRLHRDLDALAEDLADLDGYDDRYGYRYQAFRQSFVPWDDGKASARVLDTLLAELDKRG